MSLTPALSVTLGNLRYDTHVAAGAISLALLPRGGSAVIALPSNVRFEASPGDKAVLSLDGGEGSQTVLTGKVWSIRRVLSQIHVTIADAAGDLAAYRPSDTFQGQDAKSVANRLASDVSATTGTVDIDLDLAVYVAHPGRTAAEHISYLASLAGGIAYSEGDGTLNVRKRPSGSADRALKYGREVVTYEVTSASTINPQLFAMGFGPAGSGGASNALRHSVEPVPGSAAKGGVGVRRLPDPTVRVPSAASNASGALQGLEAAYAKQVTASCFLLPALRPGGVIEVQSLPDGLATGPWLLIRVEHTFERGSGGTRFWGENVTATPSLLAQLAGAVAGAIGGL